MRRFFTSIATRVVVVLFGASAALGNYCQHGWTYEDEWVTKVNVLGVGEGHKVRADITCIEIHTSGSVPYSGYHPTADGWYAHLDYYENSTTTCDTPVWGNPRRYELAVLGTYDTSGQIFCKYCDYNDD